MTSPPSSVRRTVTIKAAFDQHVENGHSPAEALKRTDDWLRSGNDQNAKPPLPADYRLELQDDDIALLAGDAVLDPAGYEIDESGWEEAVVFVAPGVPLDAVLGRLLANNPVGPVATPTAKPEPAAESPRVGRPVEYDYDAVRQATEDYIRDFGLPTSNEMLAEKVGYALQDKGLLVPGHTLLKQLTSPIFKREDAKRKEAKRQEARRRADK